MKCSSCKNSNSNDRCDNNALYGLIFCGKHAKMKNTRLWAIVNNVSSKVTKIQKIWRGYSIRSLIRECGVGCLKRSLCHNEDELITLEHKSKQYPLEYFSFEENGRIWWFDVNSIAKIMTSELYPKNPYTRVPLSIETRRRLREICHRRKIFVNEKITSKYEYIDKMWQLNSQILEENGFTIHPLSLSSLCTGQYIVLLSIFLNEMKTLAIEHNKTTSRRHHYIVWIKSCLQKLQETESDVQVPKLIYTILNDSKNPYEYCYIFSGALWRL